MAESSIYLSPLEDRVKQKSSLQRGGGALDGDKNKNTLNLEGSFPHPKKRDR